MTSVRLATAATTAVALAALGAACGDDSGHEEVVLVSVKH